MWGIVYQGESIYIDIAYTISQNLIIIIRFFYVFKEVSYAQRGLIYLIKKSSKTKEYCEILLQFKTAIFYCNIF